MRGCLCSTRVVLVWPPMKVWYEAGRRPTICRASCCVCTSKHMGIRTNQEELFCRVLTAKTTPRAGLAYTIEPTSPLVLVLLRPVLWSTVSL